MYVVDPDEAVRRSLARLLDTAGFVSKDCVSFEAFLDDARPGGAVCALIDVSSSRRPDAGLLARLRPLAARLPVIALSTDDAEDSRHLARELGSRAFFRKPVDGGALLDAIEWAMHGPH